MMGIEGGRARKAPKRPVATRGVRNRGADLRKGVDLTYGAGLSVRREREKGKWAAGVLWAERGGGLAGKGKRKEREEG
jgi:hypothetical protein